jgi:hypothetical protein
MYHALLAAALALAPSADADKKDDESLPAVLGRVSQAGKCHVELRAPGTAETYTRDASQDDRTLFWVIDTTFSPKGKGDLVLTITIPGDKKEHTFRTKDPADDLFVVAALDLKAKFPKWHKKALEAVKASDDVRVLRELTELRQAETFEKVPQELVPALDVAKAKYDERRAELVKRVHGTSLLYYPEASGLTWYARRKGDTVYFDTSCADRMYYARFRVELTKDDKGGWKYVKLSGMEEFKGE